MGVDGSSPLIFFSRTGGTKSSGMLEGGSLYVICIYPLDNSRGGRTVVQIVLLPLKNSTLGDSMPRDFGSIVVRYVRFGVTGWYSNFGGRLSLP